MLSLVFTAMRVGGQTHAAVEPITLRRLLDSASARYPTIEAARARARAARGARVTAGTLGNPMLAYQLENTRLPGREAPPMEREAMTMVTLPLEPIYQRRPRVRQAVADVRAAEADATVERQRVARQAARTFYRTALAQVGLEAGRDLSEWLDTVVAYNRARVNEGVAAEADLIRSELERDRAAAEATMQEAELARARADLAAFLSDSVVPSSELVVAITAAPLALPDVTRAPGGPTAATRRSISAVRTAPFSDDVGTMSALVDRALVDRPEVRAARERLAAAGAGVASQRTMLVRQLGATLGTKQSAGTTSLLAGVSLPIPLLDQNRGEVARASAERDAAAFELAAEERTVRAQVAGAYEAARLLTERAALLVRRGPGGYLPRADEARRIALGAYREGAVPLIQVIDAARAWGEARLAFYRTLYAQHEGVLDLLVAQGTDLTTGLPTVITRDTTGAGNR